MPSGTEYSRDVEMVACKPSYKALHSQKNLNVKRSDGPLVNRRNKKKNANSGHMSNWSKGLLIVMIPLVLETMRGEELCSTLESH